MSRSSWICLLAAVLLALGCKPAPRQVVVYLALDEPFARPLLDAFTAETGIQVLTKTDTEATKTVGLAEAILAEAQRPRCDLFWNNEVLHTLRIDRAGLLREFQPERAALFPANYRSPEGRWFGIAARARVLLVNTNLVPEARTPRGIDDLIDPQWADRAGIAKPLFGTTATHVACLFAALGDEAAREWVLGVKRNARILSGNRRVAEAVAQGQIAFGLTDTDDAMVEVAAGSPVKIVYPDQQDEGLGTLFIPNTLALLQDSPHPDEAEELLRYLLSAQVEQRLAEGPSAQIPLASDVQAKVQVETPQTVRPMQVDFTAAAAKWDEAAKFIRDEFMAAE